jgi:hypothetical protein
MCALTALLAVSVAGVSATARAWEPVADPKERAPRWSGPMIYRLNQAGSDDLDIDMLAAEVHKGMLEWTAPDCTGASARYDGLTTDLPGSAAMPGADNVIAWRESGWTDGPEALAVTAPSYIRTNSGPQVIVAATMRLNGQDWTWVKGASTGRQINIFSVLLHEGGHYWGLGHSMVPMSVMVADYSKDLTGLAPDDVDGICSLYPLGQSKDCTSSTCPNGYACTRGNCLWEGTGAPPVCTVDADCASAEHCEAGLCMKDGCVVDRDCASTERRCIGGRCMLVTDPPPVMCTSNSDCAADEVCKAGLCVALDSVQSAGRPIGSDCVMDSDCDSGLCRLADGATQCTAFCVSDADCGTVERCLRDGTKTGLCGPPAQGSKAPTHGSAEARPKHDAMGCSSTRSSSGPALAWLIAAAWLLRARRLRDG